VAVVASALVPCGEAAEPVLRGEGQIVRSTASGTPTVHRDALKPLGSGLGQARTAPGLKVRRHLSVAGLTRTEHLVEVAVIETLVQEAPKSSRRGRESTLHCPVARAAEY